MASPRCLSVSHIGTSATCRKRPEGVLTRSCHPRGRGLTPSLRGPSFCRPSLERHAMAYAPRRRFLADTARFAAALPLVDWSDAMAQQRVPRIGFMSGAEPSLIASFEDEMRTLGHSPGKTVHFEVRVGRM